MSFSAYVHVPWCRIRCPYCAFFVLADRDAPFDAWFDALQREWAARAEAFAPQGQLAETLYVGGGTPSRLPRTLLAPLAQVVPTRPDGERTIEANPEDVSPAWAEAALHAGFNRVSLGVQTLQPALAKRIARVASQQAAPAAVAALRAAGLHNLSLDLMFALPGQTLDDLRGDLHGLLVLDPPHVSIYGLTWEEETGFGRALAAGRLQEAPDPHWRAQHDLVIETLLGAGYVRYEVSNFARPGFESRHNQGYWTDRPYVGLGPSAHGYAPNGDRWEGARDLAAWITDPVGSATHERPTAEQAAIDLVISSLRGAQGLPVDRLATRTAHGVDWARLNALTERGLIAFDGRHLRITAAGLPLADALTARITDALVPLPRG